jgi:hypothetical protein
MKTVKHSFLISVLMIAAFLCGKYFAETQKQEVQKQDPPRVFIEQLKTKMNITKNRNDIEFFLNGTKMTEDIKLNIQR